MEDKVAPAMGSFEERRILVGAAAGLAATVPMTLTMALGRRVLPSGERQPLPPRTITKNALRAVGAPPDPRLGGEPAGLALAAHFAFGAGAGAVYGTLAGKTKLPPMAEGAAFGLLVWTASYLGWLPATGLLEPATRHAPRRVALMIVAHLVYGATLGLATRALGPHRPPR